MNPHNIVSLPLAASTTIAAHLRVKVSTGGTVVVAGADNVFIGTTLQDTDSSVPGRNVADIQRRAAGIHYAVVGSTTAVTSGDQIEGIAGGMINKLASGTAIGQAMEASAAVGDTIRVLFY